MPTLPAATAEVRVAATPEEAFRIFTDEIGLWWRRGTRYWNDAERGLSVRIEPGVGGRFGGDPGEGLLGLGQPLVVEGLSRVPHPVGRVLGLVLDAVLHPERERGDPVDQHPG